MSRDDALPVHRLEADPHGTHQHAPGAKLDAGKNRVGLVVGGFSRALQAVGRVGTFGAGKYSPDGWITVPNGVERYTDAMYRHLLDEAAGETLDPQTGIQHAAHAAWNALARLDLMLREQESCNRPGGTTYAALRAGVVARIGEARVLALEQDNGVRKWTHDELRGIRDHYRAALKELRA